MCKAFNLLLEDNFSLIESKFSTPNLFLKSFLATYVTKKPFFLFFYLKIKQTSLAAPCVDGSHGKSIPAHPITTPTRAWGVPTLTSCCYGETAVSVASPDVTSQRELMGKQVRNWERAADICFLESSFYFVLPTATKVKSESSHLRSRLSYVVNLTLKGLGEKKKSVSRTSKTKNYLRNVTNPERPNGNCSVPHCPPKWLQLWPNRPLPPHEGLLGSGTRGRNQILIRADAGSTDSRIWLREPH